MILVSYYKPTRETQFMCMNGGAIPGDDAVKSSGSVSTANIVDVSLNHINSCFLIECFYQKLPCVKQCIQLGCKIIPIGYD